MDPAHDLVIETVLSDLGFAGANARLARGELEAAGVVHKRRGAGTFVSSGPSRLAGRERRRGPRAPGEEGSPPPRGGAASRKKSRLFACSREGRGRMPDPEPFNE